MGLFERIVGTDPDIDGVTVTKISSHDIMAALMEWQDGAVTRAAVIAAFALRASDETDLDWLKTKFEAATNKREFVEALHRVLLLAQSQVLGYEVKATFVARVNALAV